MATRKIIFEATVQKTLVFYRRRAFEREVRVRRLPGIRIAEVVAFGV